METTDDSGPVLTEQDVFTLTQRLQTLRRKREAGQITELEHNELRLKLLDRRRQQRPFVGADRRNPRD